MGKGRRRFLLHFPSPRVIENESLVTFIWHTLRKAGLIMSLNTGETHWMSNITSVAVASFTIMQIIELFVAQNDPFRIFECISILCFFVMSICKLFSLRLYGKQWSVILKKSVEIENTERIEENAFAQIDYDSIYNNEYDFSVSTYIGRYTKSFYLRFTLLIRIYFLTAIVYIISPFFEYALRKYQNRNVVKYPHILPIWTPLDGMGIYGYLLTISLELIASVYAVSVHIVFDTTAVGLMMFMQGQFYLLHAKSERIAGCGKVCQFSIARDKLAHVKIKSCHRIHVVLVTLVKQFNQLTKYIFGFYFWTATVVLCSVAVQLKTVTELSTTHLICLLQYMGGTLAQLFILCYHGDAVQNESVVDSGGGPQGSSWWCLRPRIRQELLILIIGMSVRYQLDAAPFFSLNLPSFVQIVRTAYSCYAVLNQA